MVDDATLGRLREAVGVDTFANRYELHEEAGRGGMGVVRRAVERAGGRQLAIKVLATDVNDQARFSREVEILERLAHPAIVGYAHHGVTTDGRAYLAMDWLDGESLADRLRAGPLPIAAVIAVGERIAEALAHAHRHDILHRDLKPSNVMLVGGDPKRATLIDFGVAKDLQATTLTHTGQLVGTPAYMAPEQANGRALDARTDLFALGCILYESLTGEPAFQGGELLEVLAQVLMREPPPLDRVRPEVPRRLATVVAALLEKDPEHRVASAGVVVAELAAIRRALEADDRAALDEPSPAFRGYARTDTATVPGRPSPGPSRRRAWLVAIPVAAAAATAVGVMAVRSSSRSDAPLPDAGAPRDFTSATNPIANSQRGPGIDLAPVFVEPAPADALGSRAFVSTWCEPRGVAVLVTAYGRIVTVDRAGTVATLATIPGDPRGDGEAVACLASGRIVGINRSKPWVLEGTGTLAASAPPPHVIDAVAVGKTARWLTRGQRSKERDASPGPGAIWEWDGTGTAREIRATCERPLRLSPDGNRVACRRDDQVFVDDGATAIEAPAGDAMRWSRDGRALYMIEHGAIRRWVIDGAREGEPVGDGVAVVEVGSWAVAKAQSGLALRWVGPGTALHRDPIALDRAGHLATLTAAIPPSTVILTYGSQGLRAIDLDHPGSAPATDRHLSTILALVFAGDDLVSVGTEGRVIRHAISDHARHLAGEIVSPPVPSPNVVALADGTLAIGGGLLDPSGHFTRRAPDGAQTFGRVLGSPEVIWASVDGGITAAAPGGARTTLVPGPLPKNIRLVALSHARDLALLQVGVERAEIRRTGTGEVAFTYTSPGASFMRVALAVDTLIVADSSGQVSAVSSAGVTPLLRLADPITALAASPVSRRFAVGNNKEVLIYDLDRRLAIARGTLDSTVDALAWSDDGTRVAAAAASTALAIWRP